MNKIYITQIFVLIVGAFIQIRMSNKSPQVVFQVLCFLGLPVCLENVDSILYSVQCGTVYSVQCTVWYSVQCTVYSVLVANCRAVLKILNLDWTGLNFICHNTIAIITFANSNT